MKRNYFMPQPMEYGGGTRSYSGKDAASLKNSSKTLQALTRLNNNMNTNVATYVIPESQMHQQQWKIRKKFRGKTREGRQKRSAWRQAEQKGSKRSGQTLTPDDEPYRCAMMHRYGRQQFVAQWRESSPNEEIQHERKTGKGTFQVKLWATWLKLQSEKKSIY